MLDQLTARARSRADLAAKLASKNVPTEIAERLLDRFTEVGLINDETFARMWVEQRQTNKGLAKRALAQELQKKGIAAEIIDTVLAEVKPETEAVQAEVLARRKYRNMQNLPAEVSTRRLVGMLARKGYPPGMAYQVAKDVIGEAETGD